MNYEELTERANETITDFMERAKTADNKHTAELFYYASWGAVVLWRDLTSMMKQNRNYEIWDAIKQQDELFEKLIDRESVPFLR